MMVFLSRDTTVMLDKQKMFIIVKARFSAGFSYTNSYACFFF